MAAGGENEPMPSVLAVPIDELVVGLLAFFIVFGVLAKVALPMFLLMCGAVALIYIFPGIVTWLPQQMAAR